MARQKAVDDQLEPHAHDPVIDFLGVVLKTEDGFLPGLVGQPDHGGDISARILNLAPEDVLQNLEHTDDALQGKGDEDRRKRSPADDHDRSGVVEKSDAALGKDSVEKQAPTH